MFVRTKKRGERIYLQVAENRWEDGKVRQRVLHNLGRLDVLQATGQLESLLASAGRFSRTASIVEAHRRGQAVTTRTVRVGPGRIFGRLWREVGLDRVLRELLSDRRFEFPVERAVFLTVVHRLMVSGSDRSAEKWQAGYDLEGVSGLELHHLYRAMAWLGESLPREGQVGKTPFSPRCVKDVIEEELFRRRQDLFSGVDLVFFDTTSIYFEGEGGETLGAWGHSKDHRPDLKQLVVGMVLDGEGNPICSELWPGNTADVTTLEPVVNRLQTKFHVRNICIVADRGMIREATIREMIRREWKYILGVRMRNCAAVREDVLGRPEAFEEVYPKGVSRKDPSPLKVQEHRVQDRRYIVCLNEDQAVKDREDRKAIVAALTAALKQGDKSLIGNQGYRRFVQAAGTHFLIDLAKVEGEARFDGKWVLTTNTDLSAREVALKYKQLWMVEDIFRSMKSLLSSRPIWHKTDETIRGHVFCSFLALMLRKELQDRLETKGYSLEWADVIRDLDDLVEMAITTAGRRYIVRSESKGTLGKVFQAAGVSLGPTLRLT